MRRGHAPALQPGFPAYAAHCKRHAGEAGEPDSISAVARRTARRYLVELIDVTEERQAIEQARTKRDRALRIVEGRSSFMSQMSHKIRTPLNGIKGIIELARDHSAEPECLLDDRQRTDELSSRRPP